MSIRRVGYYIYVSNGEAETIIDSRLVGVMSYRVLEDDRYGWVSVNGEVVHGVRRREEVEELVNLLRYDQEGH